jgi:hypothetical protein
MPSSYPFLHSSISFRRRQKIRKLAPKMAHFLLFHLQALHRSILVIAWAYEWLAELSDLKPSPRLEVPTVQSGPYPTILLPVFFQGLMSSQGCLACKRQLYLNCCLFRAYMRPRACRRPCVHGSQLNTGQCVILADA